MKKTNHLKSCHRINMPETNSSSSHNLTIFSSENWINDINPDFIVERDGKRVLIIPGTGKDFGRYEEDINDTMSKMQYATFEILDYKKYNRERFERVVKDFLAVDEIEYDWVSSELIDKWGEEHPDLDWDDCPLLKEGKGEENTIDHESVELIDEEIFESDESLRQFLFSQDSWIFCGECETTEPGEKYPELHEDSEGLYLSLVPDNKKLFGNNKICIEAYRGFPYSYSKIETGRSWAYRCAVDYKPWMWITDGCGNDTTGISDNSLIILSSIWVEKVNGRFELRIGDIPSETPRNKIFVPLINEDMFKYPFPVNFYPIVAFDDWTKLESQISKEIYSNNHEVKIEDFLKNSYKTPSLEYNLLLKLPDIITYEYI